MSVPLSPEVEAKLTALATAARIECMGTCGTPHANEICEVCQDVQRQCEQLARSAYALSQEEIAEKVKQFRMDELEAVMLSVDKWFRAGDPRLWDNPATRAASAREIALQVIERLVQERDALRAALATKNTQS